MKGPSGTLPVRVVEGHPHFSKVFLGRLLESLDHASYVPHGQRQEGGGRDEWRSDLSVLMIEVNPVNDPPSAVDDYVIFEKNISLTIDVLANDFDLDGDQLVVSKISHVAGGTATNNGVDISYTPTNDFCVGSLIYEVSDGDGGRDSAAVEISIECENERRCKCTHIRGPGCRFRRILLWYCMSYPCHH